ncbi:hypothetical protein chiPu_0022151 [Chiloscyllium punctatum]|uniref:Uncharacterized protein n=1 Tax=Chiloscyllium punctatum TaxID=137246 RepID=A0A401RL68_CHIPU|nr:hypothetical protein [Chiloscyllium punctatum]
MLPALGGWTLSGEGPGEDGSAAGSRPGEGCPPGVEGEGCYQPEAIKGRLVPPVPGLPAELRLAALRTLALLAQQKPPSAPSWAGRRVWAAMGWHSSWRSWWGRGERGPPGCTATTPGSCPALLAGANGAGEGPQEEGEEARVALEALRALPKVGLSGGGQGCPGQPVPGNPASVRGPVSGRESLPPGDLKGLVPCCHQGPEAGLPGADRLRPGGPPRRQLGGVPGLGPAPGHRRAFRPSSRDRVAITGPS